MAIDIVARALAAQARLAVSAPAETFSTTAPTVVSNAFSRQLFQMPAPAAALNDSTGRNDAVSVNVTAICGRITNGDGGFYHDTIANFGVNINPDLSPINTNIPSARFAIESKYTLGNAGLVGGAGNVAVTEFHIGIATRVNTSQNEYRAVTITAPHDPARWSTVDAGLGLRGSLIYLADGLGRTRISANFSGSNSVIDYIDVASTGHPISRYDTNNRALAQQINAARNAYLTLPYFNADNALQFNGALMGVVSSAAPSSQLGGATALVSIVSASGMAAGGYVAAFRQSQTVTGSMFGLNVEGRPTVMLNSQIRNAGTGGATLSLITSGATMAYSFLNNSDGTYVSFTRYFSGGGYLALDDSPLGGAGSKESFRVDIATFQLRFTVAPRLPSATVAGLPNPTTIGAGGKIYCTNEVGGAATLECDGTNWRVVRTRAIAA